MSRIRAPVVLVSGENSVCPQSPIGDKLCLHMVKDGRMNVASSHSRGE